MELTSFKGQGEKINPEYCQKVKESIYLYMKEPQQAYATPHRMKMGVRKGEGGGEVSGQNFRIRDKNP